MSFSPPLKHDEADDDSLRGSIIEIDFFFCDSEARNVTFDGAQHQLNEMTRRLWIQPKKLSETFTTVAGLLFFYDSLLINYVWVSSMARVEITQIGRPAQLAREL